MHCASASSSAPESSACWICSGVSSTLPSGVCWLAVSFWVVPSAAGACGSCAASSGVSSSSSVGEFSSSRAVSSAGCAGASGALAVSSGSDGAVSVVSGFSVCSGAGAVCCGCAALSAAGSGAAVTVLSAAGAGSAAAGLLACGVPAVMWGTTAPTVKVSGCADSRVAAPAPPTARTSAMVSAATAAAALRRAVPDRSNRFFICCLCLRISRWCSAALSRVFAPLPGAGLLLFHAAHAFRIKRTADNNFTLPLVYTRTRGAVNGTAGFYTNSPRGSVSENVPNGIRSGGAEHCTKPKFHIFSSNPLLS